MNQQDYQKYVEGFAIKTMAINHDVFTFYMEEDKDHKGGGDVNGHYLFS